MTDHTHIEKIGGDSFLFLNVGELELEYVQNMFLHVRGFVACLLVCLVLRELEFEHYKGFGTTRLERNRGLPVQHGRREDHENGRD